MNIPPPEGERQATIPVARLIDADQYDGSNPQVTVGGAPDAAVAAGIAEIANANFFSEDTLYGEYPYPDDRGLTPVSLPILRGQVRRYFSRPAGLGLLPAHPLRAECASDAYYVRWKLVRPTPYPCVDAAVWAETARHMLPRAVGYARAALEYFFRASMRVQALYMDGGGAYIRIENLTTEEMEGVFEVYARPGVGTPSEGRDKTGLVNDGATVTIAGGATVTVPITLLPAARPTAAQVLVFRGRVGLEPEAVAGRVFTVPHVVTVQTGATAVLRESCWTTEAIENRHVQACEWPATRHIVEGELIADPAVPVIASVSARALFGRPDLELDGLPVADGVWQRADREPNPRRFRVVLPVGNPHGLLLTVSLVDGSTVSTPLAAFVTASALADRFYTIPLFGSKPPWYVAAGRSALTRVTAAPAYRALSVSAHPNPTAVVEDRFGVPALTERITVGSFAGGTETSYSQRWIDYANLYVTAPPEGPVLLQPILKAEFEALTYGPPPRVPWEALMERVYQPEELERLKTFVTTAPPPRAFTLVGQLLEPGT